MAANNELEQNVPVARSLPDLEAAKVEILSYSTILAEVETYLMRHGDTILDPDESEMKEALEKVSGMISSFHRDYQETEVNAEQLRGNASKILDLLLRIRISLATIRRLQDMKSRLRCLDIFGNVLESSSQTQEEVQNVLSMLQESNNASNFLNHLRSWARTNGLTHSFLTDATFQLPGVEENVSEKVKTLLVRFREQNIPNWYFDFVESVSNGNRRELAEFQKTLLGYKNEMQLLKSDVELACGYRDQN